MLVRQGQLGVADRPAAGADLHRAHRALGVVWLAKVGVQAGLYLAHQDTALGVARLALGYPPYALLLPITVWTVRRVTREPPPEPRCPAA